jgi:hypothetical protein
MIKRASKNKNSLNLFLNRYFSVFIVIIVILVLVLAYFFWLQPKFKQTLTTIKSNIETQQILYDTQQKKLSSLKAISELYKKIDSGDLKKFNEIFSENYIKERLFGELEEIVTANGFILDAVNLSRPEEASPADQAAASETTRPELSPQFGQINIELTVSTIDYTGFKNLTRVLENNLRLFDLVKVDFQPSDGLANFTLATYYYKKSTLQAF